jgi:DNA replication protein DnaD
MSVEETLATNKTGPKPKQLTEGTIEGIIVGRDKKIVPPTQVFELSALGCTDRDIANFFGVKEDTLRYNFADELTKGREELKISLRRAMIKNALTNMNVTMQIWLSKNLLGMADSPLNTDDTQPLPWVEGVMETEQQQGEHNEENKQEQVD